MRTDRPSSSFWPAAMALFFVVAGINHFLSPAFYLTIMPPVLPWPLALVYISGIAEIIGGIGVLPRQTRKLAGWWLILLLIAIFPANIHAARHGMIVAGSPVPEWLLLARLPLQFVLIAWVYVVCLKPESKSEPRP